MLFPEIEVDDGKVDAVSHDEYRRYFNRMNFIGCAGIVISRVKPGTPGFYPVNLVKGMTAQEFIDRCRVRSEPEKCRYDEQSKEFILDCSPASPYCIERSRCNTHRKMVEWMRHLSEKNWFGADEMRAFLKCVCKVNGWPRIGC